MRSVSTGVIFLTAGILCSCSTTVPAPKAIPVADQSSLPTASLWQRVSVTRSVPEIFAIEAELASRNQMVSGSSFVGQHTSGMVGSPTYTRPVSNQGDRDCSEFASSAAAQKFFLSSGGPYTDAHGLDRDGDGFACEFGNLLNTNANQHRNRSPSFSALPGRVRASAGPSRRVVSGSQCFVGPRGGTYTITASGNKNYGGC